MNDKPKIKLVEYSMKVITITALTEKGEEKIRIGKPPFMPIDDAFQIIKSALELNSKGKPKRVNRRRTLPVMT